MTKYICTDGYADIEIQADDAEDAAQQYVEGGDWNKSSVTDWIDVYVQQNTSELENSLISLIGDHDYAELRGNTGWSVYDASDLDIEAIRVGLPECEIALDGDGDLIVEHGYERECVTVTIEPIEPECAGEHDHDWRSPYSVLGGIKENPGVWGHGGGVILREVCAHCGRYRITDTWAQRKDTGEQGLESVKYEDADEASLAWALERRLDDMSASEISAEFGDIVVTEDNSVRAGNCRAETARAAELIRARRGLDDDDDVTVSDILAVCRDSEAALAACRHAIIAAVNA